MDPVTHGLIGATVSGLCSRSRGEYLPALITGAAAAMAPDLDVLIHSSTDPLLQLEYHRHFTHAFLFAPVGSVIIALLSHLIFKRRFSFLKTYIWSLAGMITAGIADAWTSYGVHLLWPISDERFAWNLISVFDPLFSLGILALLITAFLKRSPKWNFAGLLWIMLYLTWSLFNYHDVKHQASNYLSEHRPNHQAQIWNIKPTIANQFLWSARYREGDSLHALGVSLFPFQNRVYSGESAKLIGPEDFQSFEGTDLYQDITRFYHLSDEILIWHPLQKQVLGDGRYAMLPTLMEPLWGIEVDTLNPEKPITFDEYRRINDTLTARFKQMIFGEPIP